MRFDVTGGYVEGRSFLHGRDAFVKLLCLFLLLASVIFADTVIGYLVVVVLLLGIVRISAIGFRNALNGIRQLWMFFLLVFLMNALFTQSDTALWSQWIFVLSVEGIVNGARVVLQVAFAMVLGNILLTTTSPLEITGAIESLIFPLKYVGVPVQDVAMILGVAIQFVPTFVQEADMIKKAQTARGARFHSKNIVERAKSLQPLVIPIFISAFSRADELAIAMEARGYGRKKRTIRFKKRKITAADIWSFLICCAVCVLEAIML